MIIMHKNPLSRSVLFIFILGNIFVEVKKNDEQNKLNDTIHLMVDERLLKVFIGLAEKIALSIPVGFTQIYCNG